MAIQRDLQTRNDTGMGGSFMRPQHCHREALRMRRSKLFDLRDSRVAPLLRASGYIMIETVVAVAVLSLGAFAVNGAIQQAIQTRGQAQDFTRARFLLDSLTNELLLQPILTEGSDQGKFDGRDSRFSWAWSVSRVNPPVPSEPFKPLPPNAEPSPPFLYPRESSYLAHIHATIRWERSGMPFEESYETLLAPERLWQPPPPRVPQ